MTLATARIEAFRVVADDRDDTLFAAGSISKAVSALVALLAVELDDDLGGS